MLPRGVSNKIPLLNGCFSSIRIQPLNVALSNTSAVLQKAIKEGLKLKSRLIIPKKYSRLVTTIKNITPHKLRSTYGTNLYQESGDIYLVADVLGHKDVNTTRKHYAAQADERRRQAAQMVRLREKNI